MVLIRRLPGITACDVLSNRADRGFLITQRTDKPNTRRNVPGAACLRRFPVRRASKQISRGRLLRSKAAPLQAGMEEPLP